MGLAVAKRIWRELPGGKLKRWKHKDGGEKERAAWGKLTAPKWYRNMLRRRRRRLYRDHPEANVEKQDASWYW